MNCVIFKTGRISTDTATVTLQRGNTTVVIKNVPVDVCDNCGEYYLSEEMTARVMALAESAVNKGTEVEVLRWAAQVLDCTRPLTLVPWASWPPEEGFDELAYSQARAVEIVVCPRFSFPVFDQAQQLIYSSY